MRFKLAIALFALLTGVPVVAQDHDPIGLTPSPDDAENIVKRPSYSPYAGRNFPTEVFWGDTHVHTNNSLDARGFGVILGPGEAYRFARGEEVMTSHGEPFKLSRPLDWLVVADHSDGMGAMKEIIAGNPRLLKDPTVRGWYTAMNAGGDGMLVTAGGRTAGYAMFVKNGRLTYVYNYIGIERTMLTSSEEVPAGTSELRMKFTKTGNFEGDVELFINGESVGKTHLSKTVPATYSIEETFDVGEDTGSPIIEDVYAVPFRNEALQKLTVKVGSD